jgi:hypothetical protein
MDRRLYSSFLLHDDREYQYSSTRVENVVKWNSETGFTRYYSLVQYKAVIACCVLKTPISPYEHELKAVNADSQISLVFDGYSGLLLRGKSGQSLKLTIHLHVVMSSRIMEVYLYSPTCVHGAVLK